jgi:hypothetical protein
LPQPSFLAQPPFRFSIPHRLILQADCQSTLREIDKPLHSFNVHLQLYLRCLNGPLGLFHSSLSRPPRKSSTVFDFRLLASIEGSASFHTPRSIDPSLTQSDGHYGDIIGIITHTFVFTRIILFATADSPCHSLHLATSAKTAPRLERTFLVPPKQFRSNEVCD